MKILVDADACPVVSIVEAIAKRYEIPVVLLCDTNHILNSGYSEVRVIGAGADAVDFALLNQCQKGDIVVTQDYGLAAMVLGKGAYGIHQSGKWYTNENIDQMLMERHLNKKARRTKGKHHIKGPAKRTEEDNQRFAASFEKMVATYGGLDMKLYIKNGRVINPATNQDAVLDIVIENDRILEVGTNLVPQDGITEAQVIDASGCMVMPGFVDLHVHFRDPGLTYKEDIETGAKAAARGGVTTVCAMPNTKPVVDSVETLGYIQKKAEEVAPIHVEQLSAVTIGQNGTELVDMKAMVEKGAIAFSEDGKSVMDITLYAEAMKQAAELGAVVMAHCEDKALVRGGVLNEGVASKKFQVPGITNSVEDIITARDIFLANDYGTKLHLCHCSTAGSVELVRMAKQMGIEVTAEVCPHHFTLSDADIDCEDSNYKMNPPLRSEADVQALIRGLQDGTMEVISTDHAPHSAEEKAKGFVEAPFGIVGLETSASLTYTALVATGILTPMQMAEKMSWNPAKVIGIEKERGSLEAGKLADIVIFNPDMEYTVDVNEFASKGKNTPYDGKLLKGRVVTTICKGAVVYSL